MLMAVSSRNHLLMNYSAIQAADLASQSREPLHFSPVALFVGLLMLGGWIWLAFQLSKAGDSRFLFDALTWMATGLLPAALWLGRSLGWLTIPPHTWEVYWIAICIGASVRYLITGLANIEPATTQQSPEFKQQSQDHRKNFLDWVLLTAIALLSVWWYQQSHEYYASFMLGYNDFGHFLQRVASTATGHGWLLESPVLPAYWDHFNPGLVLLVPLWWIHPEPTVMFAPHALLLASSAWLVRAIAVAYGVDSKAANLLGLAWLFSPNVGQMNVAYTYGWHPINLAIPLLLACILSVIRQRYMLASIFCVLAFSIEEGVFVIVGLTAAACAAMRLHWISSSPKHTNDSRSAIRISGDGDTAGPSMENGLPSLAWLAIGITSLVAFLLVYRFSGLAEFQTARFVRLGTTPWEILLSPLQKPSVFWSQIAKQEHWMFLAGLLIPCGLRNVLRGWRWLLPTAFPFGVLIIWDHQPAHSLAFHYASSLLPLVWLATIDGVRSPSSSNAAFANAAGAVVASLTMSLFIGQLPFSTTTLIDVEARTYAGADLRRWGFAEDGKWLEGQVSQIRQSGRSCLATGRIAAHLVGVEELETVGQFLERRDRLDALPDRAGDALSRYHWIVLDRLETFQQTAEQTAQIQAEAIAKGFQVEAQRYEVVILKHPTRN